MINQSAITMAIASTYADDHFWDLVMQSAAQAGPFDGGCLICAKAILQTAGTGELVRIVSDLNQGQTEHYGARVGGVIYDFDGQATTPAEWIERFRVNERVPEARPLFFATGYDAQTPTPDDASAVDGICNLLNEHKLTEIN